MLSFIKMLFKKFITQKQRKVFIKYLYVECSKKWMDCSFRKQFYGGVSRIVFTKIVK